MKKILFFLMLSATIISCKNSEEISDNADLEMIDLANVKTYSGEFIYTADASVLKGNNFIYGVKINPVAEELAKKVSSVKEDDFDMVPVTVRGVVNPKPVNTEGWDEVITIIEIVDVSNKPSEADIKLEETKKDTN